MTSTHFGNVNAYKQHDIGDVANKTDSLLADSDVVENAILNGYIAQNKEHSVAKDGIVGFVQKYALFEYDFATDGGTGTVELRGTPIPAGAVIEPAKLFLTTGIAGSNASVGTMNKRTGAAISATNLKASGALTSAGAVALNTGDVDLTAQTDDITVTLTFAGTATAGAGVAKLPYFVPVVTKGAVAYR